MLLADLALALLRAGFAEVVFEVLVVGLAPEGLVVLGLVMSLILRLAAGRLTEVAGFVVG